MAFVFSTGAPFLAREVTIDPSAIGAATITQQVYTVLGLRTDMQVHVTFPSTAEQDLGLMNAWVSAKDTLALRWYSVAGVNPAPMVIKVTAR